MDDCGVRMTSRTEVEDHARACPRCLAAGWRAARRGAAWTRAHEAEERGRAEAFYAARDTRAAAWPPERIRAVMTEVCDVGTG